MTYFVQIRNATAVRKAILETTKDFLGILSVYHRMLDIRDEKITKAKRLGTILAELDELFSKANDLLPERSTEELKRYLPTMAPLTSARTEKPKPLKTTELDRLQESLALIEERLNKL